MDPVDGPILASLLGNCMCHCKHPCSSTHSSNIMCHTLVWARDILGWEWRLRTRTLNKVFVKFCGGSKGTSSENCTVHLSICLLV